MDSPGKFQTSVDRETQADCVAGAWLGYENSNGLFKGGADDATVSSFSMDIADIEQRSHGMDLERLLSSLRESPRGSPTVPTSISPGSPISPPVPH